MLYVFFIFIMAITRFIYQIFLTKILVSWVVYQAIWYAKIYVVVRMRETRRLSRHHMDMVNVIIMWEYLSFFRPHAIRHWWSLNDFCFCSNTYTKFFEDRDGYPIKDCEIWFAYIFPEQTYNKSTWLDMYLAKWRINQVFE